MANKKSVITKNTGRHPNQKMKPYIILQYLLKNSDCDHPCDASDIVAFLQDECGIYAERHSIYKDIDAINKAVWMLENNSDIEEAEEAIENDFDNEEKCIVYKHRHGFYVKNRPFDIMDLQLISECVNSAKFISKKESNNLKRKIGAFANKYDAKTLRNEVYLVGRKATTNDYVKYYIPTINDAIKNNHKISFHYTKYTIQNRSQQVERRKGAAYIKSPFQMIINDGNYYLLAFDSEAGEIRTYRVDRMKDVIELDEKREGKEEFHKLNIESYNQRVFSMFGGEQKRVKMRFTNRMLDTVVEKLGTSSNVWYIPDDNWHFNVITDVEISDQFFGWVCGLRKNATILDPPEVIEGMKKFISDIAARYE